MKSVVQYFFCILAAVISVHALEEDLTVGPEVWQIPSDGGPLPSMTGESEHSITFTWNGNHNVYIHPSGNCDATDAILVGSESPATYTFTEDDEGKTLHFVCTVGQHCQSGMRMDVAVEEHDEGGDGGDTSNATARSFVSGILVTLVLGLVAI